MTNESGTTTTTRIERVNTLRMWLPFLGARVSTGNQFHGMLKAMQLIFLGADNKGTRASALPSRMNITSALPHPQSRNPHSVHNLNMGMVWLPAMSYGMRTNGNHLEGLCSPDERTTLVLLNVSRRGGSGRSVLHEGVLLISNFLTSTSC